MIFRFRTSQSLFSNRSLFLFVQLLHVKIRDITLVLTIYMHLHEKSGSVPGYSAFLFQDGGRQSLLKTKVAAPPTVPTKRAQELTGDEARKAISSCSVRWEAWRFGLKFLGFRLASLLGRGKGTLWSNQISIYPSLTAVVTENCGKVLF